MKGCTIWLTGYSGAGKTTISLALYDKLKGRSVPCEILDGDTIRNTLSRGLTFSKEDRLTNIMRLGFVAELLSRHGVCVIVSAISPYREGRDKVRKSIGNFVEVYVKCPFDVCEQRDCKGLYKKARAGEIDLFTGVDAPYEEPLFPEVVCHTDQEKVEESADKIVRAMESLEYLE